MQRKTQVHIPALNHGAEETESHKVVRNWKSDNH